MRIGAKHIKKLVSTCHRACRIEKGPPSSVKKKQLAESEAAVDFGVVLHDLFFLDDQVGVVPQHVGLVEAVEVARRQRKGRLHVAARAVPPGPSRCRLNSPATR